MQNYQVVQTWYNTLVSLQRVAPLGGGGGVTEGADTFNHAVPVFLALLDFNLNTQEVDGDIHFAGFEEAHGVFFGGDDEIHSAVGAALYEGFEVFLVEPVVVGVAAADFHMGAETLHEAFKAFGAGDTAHTGHVFIFEEGEGAALAGKDIFEVGRGVVGHDDIGHLIVFTDGGNELILRLAAALGKNDVTGAF